MDAVLSVVLGDPGLSFRYVDTFGITEEAYPVSTAHLNAPNGLFIDGSDNLFVAEEFGARTLKYDSTGTHLMTIGMAGNKNAWDDRFEEPVDVALDAGGNIWVVDRAPNRVMQFDASGAFVRQIGETWTSGSDNDHFDWPNGIAFDSGGMLYIADMGNARVQIFDFDLSGNPVYDDTITGFSGPSQLAFDSIGRLYVLNNWSGTVERCTYTTGWSCTTFYSSLNIAYGIHIDGSDNIYIADGSDAHVLKCNTSGICSVFAGVTGVPGDDNNHFSWPADIAVDSSGNVFVSDYHNHRIQKFNSSGTYLETRGVTGTPYVVDTSRLNAPWGIEVASDGSIYVAESRGYRLLKLDPAGTQLWTVGEAGVVGSDNSHFGDWTGIEGGLGLDSSGNVYVPDTANNRVQIFDSSGAYVDTLGSYGSGNYQFSCPTGVAISPVDDSIYVLDRCNQRVQVYDASQTYQDTLGVTGVTGSDNAHFDWPYGVAVDNSGNVYVADHENHRIQIFNSSHTYVRTQGVTGVCDYDFEHFCYPFDVDVDDHGRMYVASGWSNVRVQVFDNTGAYLTTVGGAWGTASSEMGEPYGVAVDSNGNLYVTDENLHRIQKFAPGVPGWSQSNLHGFGTPDNILASTLGEFSEELYSATFHATSGAEIWKLDSGAWTSTMTGGFSDVDNTGIDHLLEFNGRLYAGTINEADGGEVWRSDNGSTWTRVVSSGFGDLSNAEVMRFAVFNLQLYAGTWSWDASNGGDIWRSSTGNSGEWTQVMSNGFSDLNNAAVVVLEEFGGMLYAGTYNSVTGGEVWRSSDGVSWGQVNADGFGEGSAARISGMATFDGYLYASTFRSNAGGQPSGAVKLVTGSIGRRWLPTASETAILAA
jgi:sugar lactone lactonase YvrE